MPIRWLPSFEPALALSPLVERPSTSQRDAARACHATAITTSCWPPHHCPGQGRHRHGGDAALSVAGTGRAVAGGGLRAWRACQRGPGVSPRAAASCPCRSRLPSSVLVSGRAAGCTAQPSRARTWLRGSDLAVCPSSPGLMPTWRRKVRRKWLTFDRPTAFATAIMPYVVSITNDFNEEAVSRPIPLRAHRFSIPLSRGRR